MFLLLNIHFRICRLLFCYKARRSAAGNRRNNTPFFWGGRSNYEQRQSCGSVRGICESCGSGLSSGPSGGAGPGSVCSRSTLAAVFKPPAAARLKGTGELHPTQTRQVT